VLGSACVVPAADSSSCLGGGTMRDMVMACATESPDCTIATPVTQPHSPIPRLGMNMAKTPARKACRWATLNSATTIRQKNTADNTDEGHGMVRTRHFTQ
jgi:hypothetical protein